MEEGWTTTTPVPFPRLQSKEGKWVAAAHLKLDELLQLLQ